MEALGAIGLLDTPPQERFDTLTRIAARVFAVPIAVVTLVAAERQWFKSCLGLDVSETPRDISFCGHAILSSDLFEVRDAALDERFRDNPLVIGPPYIRFYAGVPLSDPSGHRLGSFAIIDRRPRRLSRADRTLLSELARLVELEFERIHNEARLLEQEAQLRDADQQKDRFLATLAHELRNPLAPIRNSVHLARLRHPTDEVVGKALDVIERQSVHLTRIVDDLLEIARITKGRLVLDRRPCRLDQLTAEALEAVEPAAKAAGHALHVDIPREPLWVNADPTRIVQALQNLLNNAVKYTDRGGRVALSVRRFADTAELEVEDDGIGIASTQIERLFEPFAQDHRTLMRSSGGLGIGLALARHLVEMHGGSLTAESAGPGLGARFRVTLPLSCPPASPGREAPAAEPVLQRHVLVVDDNVDLLQSTQALLESMGHVVDTAAGGRQAIEAVVSRRPDIVLLDIGLPDLDGNAVARELKRRLGEACPPLVAITGWGQAEDRRRTADSGFMRHLTKPVDPDVLQEVIGAVGAARRVDPAGE